MSLQAMAKAIKVKDVSPTEKLVLICLANYANDENKAWPRQTTIANDCGVSRETVLRAYKSLEAKGLISSEKRSSDTGADTSKIVTLFPEGGVTQGHASVTDDHRGRDAGSQGGVTQGHTYIEPINLNQSIEPVRNPIVPLPVGDLVIVETKQDVDFDAFWKAYPRKTAKDAARKAFGRAIKKATITELLEAISRARQRDRAWRDPQFIPHAATWLNNSRWKDEYPDEQSNRFQPRSGDAGTISAFDRVFGETEQVRQA